MTKTEKAQIMEWLKALYLFGICGEKKREESLVTLRIISQDGWLDHLANMKQQTFARHLADEILSIADIPVEKLYGKMLTAYRRLLAAYETDPSLYWTASALISAWPLLSRFLQSKIESLQNDEKN